MKVLFIESLLRNFSLKLSKEEISKLPSEIFLAYVVQYKDFVDDLTVLLEKNKIKVKKTMQILGCSKLNTQLPVFLIGEGRFHAKNLYLQTSDLYVLEGNKIFKIPKSEIHSFEKKRKTAYIRYLSAEKIGILVSLKPGQENLSSALRLKKSLIKKGKKVYIFFSNNIDTNQFENFSIDSWVNTACPGISYEDSKIINLQEIIK